MAWWRCINIIIRWLHNAHQSQVGRDDALTYQDSDLRGRTAGMDPLHLARKVEGVVVPQTIEADAAMPH